jgi:hypothetical protein
MANAAANTRMSGLTPTNLVPVRAMAGRSCQDRVCQVRIGLVAFHKSTPAAARIRCGSRKAGTESTVYPKKARIPAG